MDVPFFCAYQFLDQGSIRPPQLVRQSMETKKNQCNAHIGKMIKKKKRIRFMVWKGEEDKHSNKSFMEK